MSSSAADILVGLTMVACNQFLPVANDHSAQSATPYPLTDWGQIACMKYADLGEDVEIKLVSHTLKRSNGNAQTPVRKTEKGNFDFEERHSGKIKISWSSIETNSKVDMWANLTVYDTVWVFTDNLHPYQRISGRDLVKQKTEISRYLGRYNLLSPGEDSFLTSTQVRKGDIFSTGNSTPAPMVYKNENVEITLETTNIKIVSEGKALDFGWEQGDKILVRAHNSEGPVLATVTGRNEVHVQN